MSITDIVYLVMLGVVVGVVLIAVLSDYFAAKRRKRGVGGPATREPER